MSLAQLGAAVAVDRDHHRLGRRRGELDRPLAVLQRHVSESTVTRLPVIADACITSPAWVSWISCVRLVLVLICCSTLENCTSSLVNWLVSSGLVGSWFCNCVISSLRKSLKFADSEFSAVLPVC